jgi:hypothetical protein
MYESPSRFAITPVEPGGLEAVEPCGRGLERGRRRRDPETVAAAQQFLARAPRAPLVDRVAVPEQQVEGDEDRRDLGLRACGPRLSAGWSLVCIESKSSTPSRAITISPSSAEWGGSSSPSWRSSGK